MAESTTTPQTEQRMLVARARDGDVQAFEILYRQLAPRVYGLCLRIAGNAAEAQDCTQETFIRAWRGLDGFRGDSSFGTWLHRIAINEVLGRRRKAARETGHLAAVIVQENAVHDEPGTLRDIERAIARLPERAREVFVLHKIYGYAHEEIATMMSINAGTSKSQLHRAQKLLAAALPAFAGAAEPAAGGCNTRNGLT